MILSWNILNKHIIMGDKFTNEVIINHNVLIVAMKNTISSDAFCRNNFFN